VIAPAWRPSAVATPSRTANVFAAIVRDDRLGLPRHPAHEQEMRARHGERDKQYQ
jgi:hypothetical protein